MDAREYLIVKRALCCAKGASCEDCPLYTSVPHDVYASCHFREMHNIEDYLKIINAVIAYLNSEEGGEYNDLKYLDIH